MPANENAARYFSKLKGPKPTEALLHKHLAQWLKLQYPGILFRSGMEGARLSENQARQFAILNSHEGQPDLLIFEPVGEYCGLALELKKDGAALYKKDGTLRKSEHLTRQAMILEMLSKRKWKTGFVQGFEEGKQAIEAYLNPAQ